jgi:hypothetical protein
MKKTKKKKRWFDVPNELSEKLPKRPPKMLERQRTRNGVNVVASKRRNSRPDGKRRRRRDAQLDASRKREKKVIVLPPKQRKPNVLSDADLEGPRKKLPTPMASLSRKIRSGRGSRTEGSHTWMLQSKMTRNAAGDAKSDAPCDYQMLPRLAVANQRQLLTILTLGMEANHAAQKPSIFPQKVPFTRTQSAKRRNLDGKDNGFFDIIPPHFIMFHLISCTLPEPEIRLSFTLETFLNRKQLTPPLSRFNITNFMVDANSDWLFKNQT